MTSGWTPAAQALVGRWRHLSGQERRHWTLRLVTVLLAALFFSGATPALALDNAGPIALTNLPGQAAWVADRTEGLRLPDPATATPAQVSTFIAALTPAQRDGLLRRHPNVLGDLNGVPVPLRYQANRIAIRAAITAATARLHDLSRQIRRPTPTTDLLALRDAEAAAKDRRAMLTRWSHSSGQFLFFDPRGPGRVAQVWGDLTTARHVAIIVPGAGTTIDNFDSGGGHNAVPARDARRLLAATKRLAPGDKVAVIGWLGYVTPPGIDEYSAGSALAKPGATDLAGFVNSFGPGVHVSVFCHSYGSVVCGRAAPAMQVSDIVVFGSPGMDVSSVNDLGTTAKVWATRARSDWIRYVPHVRVDGYGHGADPAGPSFGSTLFRSDGVTAHGDYFHQGAAALANFARIAVGDYAAVR
jgi:Alpha/beta hydrolase